MTELFVAHWAQGVTRVDRALAQQHPYSDASLFCGLGLLKQDSLESPGKRALFSWGAMAE